MKSKGRVQAVLKELVEILRQAYDPERIILFGSYAYGTPTRDSDMDILIVKKTSVPFYRRLTEVRRLVSPARRGIPFDPMVMTPKELTQRLANGDQFFQEIIARGQTLYSR